MPFTPENVDSLYKLTYDGKNNNINFKPSSRGNQRVSLLIQDHQNNGGMVKEVFWSSVEESLRVFKEKDFNHLWNSLYLPQAIREQLAMDRLGVVDSDQQINNDNSNTNFSFSGPNVNNTNVYK